MRFPRTAAAALVLGLLLAPATGAQTIGAGASGFRALDAGDQRIARALFEAQSPPSLAIGTETTPLTLDEIAALRSGRSWETVLREMRARHLVALASLREVILRYERPARGGGEARGIVAVTTAGGRTSIVGSTRAPSADAP